MPPPSALGGGGFLIPGRGAPMTLTPLQLLQVLDEDLGDLERKRELLHMVHCLTGLGYLDVLETFVRALYEQARRGQTDQLASGSADRDGKCSAGLLRAASAGSRPSLSLR